MISHVFSPFFGSFIGRNFHRRSSVVSSLLRIKGAACVIKWLFSTITPLLERKDRIRDSHYLCYCRAINKYSYVVNSFHSIRTQQGVHQIWEYQEYIHFTHILWKDPQITTDHSTTFFTYVYWKLPIIANAFQFFPFFPTFLRECLNIYFEYQFRGREGGGG